MMVAWAIRDVPPFLYLERNGEQMLLIEAHDWRIKKQGLTRAGVKRKILEAFRGF